MLNETSSLWQIEDLKFLIQHAFEVNWKAVLAPILQSNALESLINSVPFNLQINMFNDCIIHAIPQEDLFEQFSVLDKNLTNSMYATLYLYINFQKSKLEIDLLKACYQNKNEFLLVRNSQLFLDLFASMDYDKY